MTSEIKHPVAEQFRVIFLTVNELRVVMTALEVQTVSGIQFNTGHLRELRLEALRVNRWIREAERAFFMLEDADAKIHPAYVEANYPLSGWIAEGKELGRRVERLVTIFKS